MKKLINTLVAGATILGVIPVNECWSTDSNKQTTVDLRGLFLERTKLNVQQAVRQNRFNDLKEIFETLEDGNEQDFTVVKNAIDKHNNTLLHIAAENNDSNDIMSYLLEKGADFNANAQNDDGDTPLHLAVRNGKIDIVECLLTLDADVNIRNNAGQTPLDIARTNNNQDIIDLLTQNANETSNANNVSFHSDDDENQNTINLDNKKNESEQERIWRKMTPDEFKSAVIRAVYNEDHGELEELLESRAAEQHNINTENIKDIKITGNGTDNTLLHIAAENNKSTLVALYLLRFYKDNQVNVKNADGNTPLHLAVRSNNAEMVKLLLEYAADANIRNNDGKTALDIAKENHNQNIIAILPPTAEAEFFKNEIKDEEDDTDLFKNEIRTDETSNYDDIPSHTEVQNNNGDTELHKAVRENDIDLVRVLVDQGVDIYERNKAGKTALDIAIENHNDEVVNILLNKCDKTDNVINIPSHTEVQNNNGDTELHKAVRENDIEMVRGLIAGGADINKRNNENKTALEIALENDNEEIANILLGYND